MTNAVSNIAAAPVSSKKRKLQPKWPLFLPPWYTRAALLLLGRPRIDLLLGVIEASSISTIVREVVYHRPLYTITVAAGVS